tara:strand:- start:4412 stop:5305 length:894 start_codon:yes stop_codon:yes gene_type:complete
MSTQQARNIIINEVDALIDKAKETLKAEGRKKIAELKQQIPTPQELARKLLVDTNNDSCSAKGREKFMKIYNKINDTLTDVESIIGSALEILENIKNDIDPIVGGDGPLGKLESVTNIVKEPISILQKVILAAPALFAANSGPSSSGAVQEQLTDKKNKAISKIGEYVGLIALIALMIPWYINEARKIFIPLNIAKSKLDFIKDEIIKLKLYLYSFLLKYESECQALLDSQNVTPTYPPEPSPSTPLEDYLEHLAAYYDDVYAQLQASGATQATKRMFTIKETFEEDYNISFTTINF